MRSRRAFGRMFRVIGRPTSTLTFQLHFRTASPTVEPHDIADIERWRIFIAEEMAADPGLELEIEGFADVRGSRRFNRVLARKRAESVAALLTKPCLERCRSFAIPGHRVRVVASGACWAMANRGDRDGYAFDRRVVVRITSARAPGTVPRPRLASDPPCPRGSFIGFEMEVEL